MNSLLKNSFAPQLYIDHGVYDITFYQKTFGAVERHRWTNDDGSIHVAEFSIGDILFHLHEITDNVNFVSPKDINKTTVLIGLFVDDVDVIMKNASDAGAKIISHPKDYEYGYRQGQFIDPFGHIWMIEKQI